MTRKGKDGQTDFYHAQVGVSEVMSYVSKNSDPNTTMLYLGFHAGNIRDAVNMKPLKDPIDPMITSTEYREHHKYRNFGYQPELSGG